MGNVFITIKFVHFAYLHIYAFNERLPEKKPLDRLSLNSVNSLFYPKGLDQVELLATRISYLTVFMIECKLPCAMCELNDIDVFLFYIDLILVVVNFHLFSLRDFI